MVRGQGFGHHRELSFPMRYRVLAFLAVAAGQLSATNIAFTDSNLLTYGWSASGGNYVTAGQDAPILFTVNIGTNTLRTTACSAIGGGTFHASIDGAAAITITPASGCGGGPQIVTISSSLTPGNHSVYVWGSLNDTVLSGTAAFVTDGSGTVADSRFGTVYDSTNSTYSTNCAVMDGPQTQATSGYHTWPEAYYGAFGTPPTETGQACYATTVNLAALVYVGSGAAYVLYSDGTQVATAAASTTIGGAFQWIFFTGLDPAQHLYRVEAYLTYAAQGVVAMMPSGTIDARAVTARPLMVLYGDSIPMYSHWDAGTDYRLGWSQSTEATGYDISRSGQGGTDLVTVGYPNVAAVWASAYATPKVVDNEWGSNDMQHQTDLATFQTDVTATLTAEDAHIATGGKLLWEGILPGDGAAHVADRPAYIAAEVAGVAAYSGTHPACFYSTDNWILGTPPDTYPDNLHPVPSNAPSAAHPFGNPLIGQGKIDNRLAFILAGYGSQGQSFGISGPASGTVGVAQTLTITVPITGQVFDGETATLTDSSSGAFTPNPVTLTNAATSVTVSYTPASAGAKSITASVLADCWTAPGAFSFTASAPASSGAVTLGGVSVSGALGIR